MDPISIGLAAVGLGMQLFGGISSSEEAKKQAQISQQNFALENKVNDQRRQAMELSANRQSLENYRNVQRAKAAGLNAAVGQHAEFGSGLQGGQAQASDQGMWNAQGIAQNLEIGRNIFGLNSQISGNKALISQSQSAQATDQGISNFGGSLVKNSSTISNIASFGQAQSNNIFGGYPGTYTRQTI